MFRFPWTSSVDKEKLLLKKCHAGDSRSLRKFTDRSYHNEVFRAVRSELQGDYDPKKIDLIAALCVTHVYALWNTLPSPVATLHVRVRKAAKAFASDWRRRDLGT